MNKTYVYRKHLRAPFRNYILIELYLFIAIMLMVFGLQYVNEREIDVFAIVVTSVVIGIMFLFLLIEIGLIYLFLIKRFKAISVKLTDDGIIYTNSKGQKLIPYENIERLEFPSIKYTGGWVKIIYYGGNIRLTVVLEEIGDFVRELKEKLDERNMSHIYSEKKIFSFYKTAVFSDGSWGRLYKNFRYMLVVHYLCIILTIVIMVFVGSYNFNSVFIYGSLIAPLLGYLISEFIVGKKLSNRLNQEELRLSPSDPDLDNRNFKILMTSFSVGYIILIFVLQIL